jgi:hypothetical protein
VTCTASGLPFLLAAAAMTLSIGVSANLLYVLGIDYAHPGGNPLVKFHPATWALALGVASLCASMGDPLRALKRLLSASPALAGFLALMTVTMLFSALSVGLSGATVYVESYLSAGLACLLLRGLTDAQRRSIATLIVGLLVLNAAIAIGESLTGTHFVPIYLEETALVDEAGAFRPSALADHPLTAAMLTVTGLCLSLAIRAPFLPAIVALFAVALLAFGGRASLAVALVAGGLALCRALWRDLLARRMTARRVLYLLGAATVAPLGAAFLLASTGIGNRVMEKLYLDSSAQSRGAEWAVLSLLDPRALLFGSPIADTPGLIFRVGIDRPLTDIENCWLLAFINLGIVGFVPFAAAIACLVVHLWRTAAPWGRVAIVALLVTTSSSNSLGRKSNVLLVLAAAVETGLPRTPRGAHRPVQASTGSPLAAA